MFKRLLVANHAKRLASLIIGLPVLFVFSGCATFSQDGGFDVVDKNDTKLHQAEAGLGEFRSAKSCK